MFLKMDGCEKRGFFFGKRRDWSVVSIHHNFFPRILDIKLIHPFINSFRYSVKITPLNIVPEPLHNPKTDTHHNIVEEQCDDTKLSIFILSLSISFIFRFYGKTCILICWFIWLENEQAAKKAAAISLSLCHGLFSFERQRFCANLCIMRLLIFEVIPLFVSSLIKSQYLIIAWLFKGFSSNYGRTINALR